MTRTLPYAAAILCVVAGCTWNASSEPESPAAPASSEAAGPAEAGSSALVRDVPPEPPSAAPPQEAEFAIRWDPAQGGPGDASAVLGELGKAPPPGTVLEKQEYEVQYLEFSPPVDAPLGVRAILRERKRITRTRFQLTLKYRAEAPFPPSPDDQSWACPLAGAQREAEVDVSILGASAERRAYARSCTARSDTGPVEVPPSLEARRPGCVSRMTRVEVGELRVEDWKLQGDVRTLEVSRRALDTPAELEAFRKDVVAPLLRAKAVPLDRSKTDLGSGCRDAKRTTTK